MTGLWTHPIVLRSLYATAMLKAFLRFRNPRRQQSGRNLAEFHEKLWDSVAQQLGGRFELLGADIGQIRVDGKVTRVSGNVSAIDDPVTLQLAHEKSLVHQILQGAGLSVPPHATFALQSIDRAVAFLKDAKGQPCVVKPASGTGGGRGVTTGIIRAADLARAAAWASVYGDDLLIERQLPGDNYRLLYLDGELIDAFVRKLPFVVGDGRTSIRRLIQKANEERLTQSAGASQVLLSIDQDMYRTLERQGLKLNSVLPAGQEVMLKAVVNENRAADNRTASLCDSIVRDGATAVRALRLRFAGVDIVTPDPDVPLAASGGAIIEVNGTPNLYFHYRKADGETPVALMLMRHLLLSSVDSPGEVFGDSIESVEARR